MNKIKKTHQRGNADGMVAESGEAVRFSNNGVETVIRKDGITITNRTGRELTARLSAQCRSRQDSTSEDDCTEYQ